MGGHYWIISISEDNLEIALKYNLIGLPSTGKKLMLKISDGDHIVFYIGKQRAGYGGGHPNVLEFGPIAKIEGSAFYDETKIWRSRRNEKYPWRRKISILSEKRIKVQDVLKKLDFIRNKKKWGVYFIKGAREIPQKDYVVLRDALK